MSTLIQPDEIKAEVSAHYAARIQSGSSCCSPSSSACCGDAKVSTEVALYGAETIAELPSDMVTTSFGCGNPLAIASLKQGEVVLDLGSGGGLDVILAAKQVGSAGYVYGLDMTDEMLAVARRNAQKVGAENVEFIKGDIENIPLPADTVDTIISNCVINLAPDKGQVLTEAFRVLKPGGRVAVSDIVVDGRLDDLPVSEAQIRAGLSWAGCIAGALTRSQYEALLAQAGFGEIEVEVRQRYSTDDFVGRKPAEFEAIPTSVINELVGRFTSCAIRARKPV